MFVDYNSVIFWSNFGQLEVAGVVVADQQEEEMTDPDRYLRLDL